MLGRIYLQDGNLDKALEVFEKANNIEYCAYCHFLKRNFNEARIMLTIIKDSSSFVNWLLFLIELLEDNKPQNPSFFQIRNFFEQDLEMLFTVKQYDLIEKIIKKIKYLELFNKEIYKFSARVFFNHELYNSALNLLKKSAEIFYKDPETHYMLGEIYLRTNNIKEAIKEFKISDEVNNGYLPAIKRLKELIV